MRHKAPKILICLLIAWIDVLHAQPVQKWQDRHGEWHFGDPRAAPARGSSDVQIQQPISVVKNDHPLPRYQVSTASDRPRQRQNRSEFNTSAPRKRSKSDCERLRESLTLHPARQQQHRQRQQQYERECVMGVYYADSHQ